MAKQQFFKLKISEKYNARERRAIAKEVIDQVRNRTATGVDKNGARFPSYSDGYKSSLKFRLGGKKGKPVNIYLSGEVMGGIKLVEHKTGELKIGYNKSDTRNNNVAEGNIKGSYGGNPDKSKARDYLGITKNERKEILNNYPVKKRSDLIKRVALIESTTREAKKLVKKVNPVTDAATRAALLKEATDE